MHIVKTELLTAIKAIRKEYTTDRHESRTDKCHLCLLYYEDANRKNLIFGERNCTYCPMTVFGRELGCLKRRTRATASSDIINCFPERKALIIKFYDRFIYRVKHMSEEELNAPDAFKFLIGIDDRIYKKFIKNS